MTQDYVFHYDSRKNPNIGPASKRILAVYFFRMNQSQLKAESNIRAGRKRRSTKLGSIKLKERASIPYSPKFSHTKPRMRPIMVTHGVKGI